MTDKAVARYDGPRTLDDLERYALLLAVNSTPDGHAWANQALPAAFRGNPAAVAFATEYAKALDVSPVTAIMGVHMIDGKLAASSGLISALVRRAGHKIRTWIEGSIEEGTAKAFTTIVRADDPDFTYRSEWPLSRAVRAELMKRTDDGRVVAVKTGSGWAKYPENMLKARTITEAARDAAEDAILGVHYTPEELGVDVDEVGEPVAPTTRVEHVETIRQPATPAPAQGTPAADTPRMPSTPGADTDAVREAILDARTPDDLTAVWKSPPINSHAAVARALVCGDESGVETTVFDLFVKAGDAIKAGKPLRPNDDDGTVEGTVEPDPDDDDNAPADEHPDAVDAVEVPTPETTREPAPAAPPAADLTPAERAQLLSTLPILTAKALLSQIVDSLPPDMRAEAQTWAGEQGLNPTHASANSAAIATAISIGDAFTDPTLLAIASGELPDPASVVAYVLANLETPDERVAREHAEAAQARVAGPGSAGDRAASAREQARNAARSPRGR